MSTMAGVLAAKDIRKNILENEELLLPMMKEAKKISRVVGHSILY